MSASRHVKDALFSCSLLMCAPLNWVFVASVVCLSVACRRLIAKLSQSIETVATVNQQGAVRVGAAQLMNKLNGDDFNDADEQLFEVCTHTRPAGPLCLQTDNC